MKLFIESIGNGNRIYSEDTLPTSYYPLSTIIPYLLSTIYYINTIYREMGLDI